MAYSQRSGVLPASERALQFDATREPRAMLPLPPGPSPQPSLSLKKRLPKARPDGYESDGGYVSEGGKGKKENEKQSKKGKGKNGDGDGGAEGGTDYDSDGARLSKVSVKNTKGKPKGEAKGTDSPPTDYESDKGYSSVFSRSRSRSKKPSVMCTMSGDESNGGYLSESTKKRHCFRLNFKSPKMQDLFDSAQDQPPPVPALPTLPLPIHDKFRRWDSSNSSMSGWKA